MEELFETLYEEYKRKVYGYFYVCFRNRETAEDLTQQVFMKVFRYLNQNRFFVPDAPRAWVFKITVNVKNDHLRALQRQIRCDDIEHVTLKDELHTSETVIDGLSIYSALNKLSDKEQEVILLKNMGYTSSEIGVLTGTCESTVRSRLQSAKSRFGAALSQEDSDLLKNG